MNKTTTPVSSLGSGLLLCGKVLFIYLLCGALFAVFVYCFVKPKDFIMRKLLHMIAFLAPVLLLRAACGWLSAAVIELIAAVLFYPLLSLLEHMPWYSKLLVEKQRGEVKTSLLLFFAMSSALTALCGSLDRIELAAAAIVMWGFGDAMAAIIGKLYGKHHFRTKFADPSKTVEGSLAMWAAAALFGMAALTSYSVPFVSALFLVLPTSVLAAAAELCSRNGMDTVIVPSVCAISLLILRLFV